MKKAQNVIFAAGIMALVLEFFRKELLQMGLDPNEFRSMTSFLWGLVMFTAIYAFFHSKKKTKSKK